jgi:hypothetical protein
LRRQILVDADVAVHLHEWGVWDAFVQANTVYAGAIVLDEVARVMERKGATTTNLTMQVSQGKIMKVHCDANDWQCLQRRFDPVLGPDLHPGELEELCCLEEGLCGDAKFCTADKAALFALVLIGLGDRAVSLEEALCDCGLSRNLPYQCTRDYKQKWLKRCSENRIRGIGLRKNRRS